jgi:hypothetical protein
LGGSYASFFHRARRFGGHEEAFFVHYG